MNPFFRKVLKRTKYLCLCLSVMGAIAGCQFFAMTPKSEPLPQVASLPLPQLPDWIEKISPTGETQPLNQIRVIFKEPLIPLEALDSDSQQKLLSKFEILPKLPGQFRFLTPKMVGFQADQALPLATRVRVTLKAGLADLKNHRLEQDLAWTFNTQPLKLTNLPGSVSNPNETEEAIDIQPTLKFTSNAELNLDSLKEHLQLTPQGKDKSVPLKVNLAKPEEVPEYQQPEAEFNPAEQQYSYTVIPERKLDKATRYSFAVTPGLLPAHGNLASEFPFTSQVSTYAPLAFEQLKSYGQPDAGGAYGRFMQGSAQLKFNNGLDGQSALEHISINPPTKESIKPIQAYDNDTIVNLNPWALEPDITYTITVDKNLKDKFGQTLGKPLTLTYKTGDSAPDIWTPTGLNIFPTGQDLQLNISSVNLPENNYQAIYRVVQPTDLVYIDSAYPSGQPKDVLPKSEPWDTYSITNLKNQTQEIAVNLREKLGSETGMLAYGVKARTNRYQQDSQETWREPEFYGMVQLTNLGLFSQFYPDSGFIKVNHLQDGSPVNNAPVQIYQSQLDSSTRANPTPCATGTTNDQGILTLNAANLRQCMQGSRFSSEPNLLVIARENQDWAFSRVLSYSGIYSYDLPVGWQGNKPESRGVIFSDRKLYKPGEKAMFTGAAYYLRNGELQQDENIRYTVSLQDPQGEKQEIGQYNTNEFGLFSLELPLTSNQPLGNYQIIATNDTGVEITGEFRVAEFKPPNFKVDLTLDKEFAQIGETVEITAKSNYLFGSPVAGGKANYYITRNQTEFTPKGWEKFSFGRQWFYPEESPKVPSDVLQNSTSLDAAGTTQNQVKISDDLPYPMQYRVDVEVSDVSNLSVADSQGFVALPNNRLIGLKSNFVADANQAFPIEVIVTDAQGNAISNENIRLELQQMNYSSVTRVIEGGRTEKSQVEYKTVAQTQVKSGNQPISVSLTPPDAGSYRIRANFSNAKDEKTATDLQIWVTGSNLVGWRSEEKTKLEIKLDKSTYKPGEIATALLQSPYPEGEVYFAVVRDKPLYQTLAKVTGSAPQIQFTVTPDMLPNAAVEAVLVRQGQPLPQTELGEVENLVKIGFVPFKVNLEEKYLKVDVTPNQPQLEPNSQQTVQLSLKDSQNQPVQGQFTVMVVNEAVLQLSGYRPPNLVETVYAEQPISTRFSDNRPDVVLQSPASPLAKGWGYGGGFSAGADSTRIRKNFQPFAYYNGSVLTDRNGQAQISFTVPDDLTTWRVMVVATDGNLRFGQGEATFMSTQALQSNPVLPQFARVGDRLLAGLSIIPNAQQQGNLQVTSEVSGGIRLDNNNPNRQTLQTKLQNTPQAYRFPMLVDSVGTSQVRFTTQLNTLSDAFEVPLEVKPLEVTEQVVETGTTQTGIKLPLNVEKSVAPDTGGLDITLASTLIPEISAPAKQVFAEKDFPFLEPAASQLLIAANLQQLGRQYNQTFSTLNLPQEAAQALNRLAKLQRSDGGFASYPGQRESDAFISPYVGEALASAVQAGFTVDNSLLSSYQAYLRNLLADPGKVEFCKDSWCKNYLRLKSLIALSALGDTRNEFLSDIFVQRDEFDTVTQIQLTRYLSQFPEWQQETQLLLDDLQEKLAQTARSATLNLPKTYRWFTSPTQVQAEALQLFIANNNGTKDKLLQGLLNLRRNGTWGSTYNNAKALSALVDYAQQEATPPNFNVQVQLAGKQLGRTQFNGYRNPSWELNVPMTDLPKGRQELTIGKSGTGRLHYLLAYRYRLQGNQPGRLNGLRVIREIRPVGESKSLTKVGLYAKDKPIEVKPGQVFDIDLQIITDHPVDHVNITDPLPAGFEAVDANFATSTPAIQAPSDSWEINYQQIYSDRIVAYADSLTPGVYHLHYLVRSVTPGSYLYPGAEAKLQYAPEEFGRNASTRLVVQE